MHFSATNHFTNYKIDLLNTGCDNFSSYSFSKQETCHKHSWMYKKANFRFDSCCIPSQLKVLTWTKYRNQEFLLKTKFTLKAEMVSRTLANCLKIENSIENCKIN
jgi:hypothetical protein